MPFFCSLTDKELTLCILLVACCYWPSAFVWNVTWPSVFHWTVGPLYSTGLYKRPLHKSNWKSPWYFQWLWYWPFCNPLDSNISLHDSGWEFPSVPVAGGLTSLYSSINLYSCSSWIYPLYSWDHLLICCISVVHEWILRIPASSDEPPIKNCELIIWI